VTEGSSITWRTAPTSAAGIEKARGSENAMQSIIQSGLSTTYELLCSNALQSLLVTALSLEFYLRSNQPSRLLDENNILETVRGQYGKHSGEVDIFRYVDYYTEIRTKEKIVDNFTSIGHPDLQVMFHSDRTND